MLSLGHGTKVLKVQWVTGPEKILSIAFKNDKDIPYLDLYNIEDYKLKVSIQFDTLSDFDFVKRAPTRGAVL